MADETIPSSVMDRKHTGAASEMLACSWLFSQGYEVFRNMSAFGLADIVAWKIGEPPIAVDVKTIKLLTEDGRPAGFNCNPISAEQTENGVRPLYVYLEEKHVSWSKPDQDPDARARFQLPPRTHNAHLWRCLGIDPESMVDAEPEGRVVSALVKMNLSTTGAARLLGVSPSTVRGWLAGTRNGAPTGAPEPAIRLLELAAEMPEVRRWLEDRASVTPM